MAGPHPGGVESCSGAGLPESAGHFRYVVGYAEVQYLRLAHRIEILDFKTRNHQKSPAVEASYHPYKAV
jgi:hypothetical protein